MADDTIVDFEHQCQFVLDQYKQYIYCPVCQKGMTIEDLFQERKQFQEKMRKANDSRLRERKQFKSALRKAKVKGAAMGIALLDISRTVENLRIEVENLRERSK